MKTTNAIVLLTDDVAPNNGFFRKQLTTKKLEGIKCVTLHTRARKI